MTQTILYYPRAELGDNPNRLSFSAQNQVILKKMLKKI
jgi:glycyl-tRNA synthetase alpha subunit